LRLSDNNEKIRFWTNFVPMNMLKYVNEEDRINFSNGYKLFLSDIKKIKAEDSLFKAAKKVMKEPNQYMYAFIFYTEGAIESKEDFDILFK
jgi:hypothetical protein